LKLYTENSDQKDRNEGVDFQVVFLSIFSPTPYSV